MMALAAGALLGAGFYVLYLWWAPPVPSLADARARLYASPDDLAERSFATRARQRLLALARTTGVERLLPSSVSKDLRALDRTSDQHLAESLLLTLLGFAVGPVMGVVMWLVGGPVLVLPAIVSVVFATAGFFGPTLALRPRADERRRAMRHALSAFVDVAFLSVAAGVGPETALRRASGAADGWAFGLIRERLALTDRLQQPLWDGLDRLGREIDVVELCELAASLRMAGTSGARLRQALSSKSAAMRERLMTDTEKTAVAAAENMSIPMAILTLGCLVFLGYPAVATVLNSI